jgi:2-polyprenyl-3-methyl-5-hydroxy-6-metoxy-1,4-benzoquinol methylase
MLLHQAYPKRTLGQPGNRRFIMTNVFGETARWYDAIYANIADYPRAVAQIDAIVTKQLGSGNRSLLDVACGTGRLLQEFQKLGIYRVAGTDLDPEMLAIARNHLPDTPLHQSDMVELDLGQKFDVITCLGSSLPAVETTDRLQQAIYRFAKHLKPNGVLIVETFISPEDWEDGRLSATFVDEPELKIARMARSSRRDNVAVMDLHYLISTPDKVEQFIERHELGLFTDEDYKDAFRSAGLHAEKATAGLLNRPTWIGRHAYAG